MSSSQSQAEPEGNAVIAKVICKSGVSRGGCSAVSLSEEPSCECRNENSHCGEEKAPPPPHQEEMAVFVARFGEPQGVVYCKKKEPLPRQSNINRMCFLKGKDYGDF